MKQMEECREECKITPASRRQRGKKMRKAERRETVHADKRRRKTDRKGGESEK